MLEVMKGWLSLMEATAPHIREGCTCELWRQMISSALAAYAKAGQHPSAAPLPADHVNL
jgi:hypothetical protein